MKGVPEWFPIIGEKKVAQPAVSSGPTTPFSASSAPTTESPIVTDTSMAAVEPNMTLPASETVTAAPGLGALESVSPAEAIGAIPPSPMPVESAPAAVDAGLGTGTSDSTKDNAIGMAAMTNAFPGQVMQQPQEVATPAPLEEKPAA